jgi:hypothetical protein
VLEVVDEEERLGLPGRGANLIGEWLRTQLLDADRNGQGGGNQPVIAHRRERDEAQTAGEVGGRGRGRRQGEAGLAHAAGSREGEETHARAAEQRADLRDLALPPDQARQRRRNRDAQAGLELRRGHRAYRPWSRTNSGRAP